MKPVSEERSVSEQLPPWTGPVATSERAVPLDLPGFLTRERHRIHLVGVAGSGMSGIAALLIELGHTVSGSDKVSTMETDRLRRLGLRFHERHRPEEAKRHATEAIQHFTAVGEQEGTSTGLELLAAALDDAQPREAARLLGLAAILRDALGTVRGSPEQSLLDRTLERVRARLGTSEFASFFDSVRELDPAAVMAEAALKARALD